MSAKKTKAAVADTTTIEARQHFTYFLFAAIEAMNEQRFDDAVALSEYAHRLCPTDPTICYFLGWYNEVEERTNEAMKMYKLAYEGAPTHYYSDYAVFLYQSGNKKNIKEAKRIFKEQLKRDPTNEEAVNILQRIYEVEKNWKEAIRTVENYEKIYAVSASTTYQKYSYWMQMSKTKQAYQTLVDYTKLDPENPYILVTMAQHNLQNKREKEGLAQFDFILKRFPDYAYAYSQLADYYGSKGDSIKQKELSLALLHCDMECDNKIQLIQKLSTSLAQMGMADSVHLALLDEFPQEPKAHQLLINWYLAQGNQQKAHRAAETLLDVAPDDLKSWELMIGMVLADTTQTTAGQRNVLQRARDHFPENTDIAYTYARLLAQDSLYKEMIAVVNSCLQQALKPAELSVFYMMKGDAYGGLMQLDSCFFAYEKALQISPKNANVLNNYAWNLAIKGGDLKKAERMSLQSLEGDNKNNPIYLDTYAWILHLMGQKSLANFYIRRAKDLAKDSNNEELIKEIQAHYDAITKK